MFDRLEEVIHNTSSLLLTHYFVNSLKDEQIITFIYHNCEDKGTQQTVFEYLQHQ